MRLLHMGQCARLRKSWANVSMLRYLRKPFEEEKEADEKLTELAKQINVEADEGSGQAEEKQRHTRRDLSGLPETDRIGMFMEGSI